MFKKKTGFVFLPFGRVRWLRLNHFCNAHRVRRAFNLLLSESNIGRGKLEEKLNKKNNKRRRRLVPADADGEFTPVGSRR